MLCSFDIEWGNIETLVLYLLCVKLGPELDLLHYFLSFKEPIALKNVSTKKALSILPSAPNSLDDQLSRFG